jgi:lysyl endopeptidase
MLTPAAAMQLYPNPATDVLNISYNTAGKPSAIVITDLMGSTVATITDINNTGTASFNTSSLPAGIYIARMHSANGIVSQKFAVAH